LPAQQLTQHESSARCPDQNQNGRARSTRKAPPKDKNSESGTESTLADALLETIRHPFVDLRDTRLVNQETAGRGETDSNRASSVGEWLGKVPFAATLIPVVLVILRVTRVSRGQVPTELQLVGSSGALAVVFGALASVIPYLLVGVVASLAAGGAVDWRQYHDRPDCPECRDSKERALILWTAALSLGSLALLTVPLWELLFLVVWAAALTLGMWIFYRVVVGQWRPNPGPLIVAAALAFLLIQVGFDDRLWVPPAIITYIPLPESGHITGEQVTVGYVLKQDSDSVTFVYDYDRTIARVQSQGLTVQLCSLPRTRGLGLLESRVQASRSLLELLTNEARPSNRSCRDLIKSMSRGAATPFKLPFA
jgi:hypothetical protein